jgi:hypothetical protein
MSDWTVGVLVSACVFAGGIAGMLLYRLLPAEHQSTETRDNIRLAIGMISILASLVLGLLTASAKQTFDRADQELRGFAADLIILNQTLRDYGPETAEARATLRQYTDRAVKTTWSDQATDAPNSLEDPVAGQKLQAVEHMVIALKPTSEDQHMLRGQALTLANQLVRARWTLLVNQSGANSPKLVKIIEIQITMITSRIGLSAPSPILLVIMVIWISMIFTSFGLFAPHNATVVIAFFICSLSIGTSIFLIREMDSPFDGVIMVSGDAMRSAAAHMAE